MAKRFVGRTTKTKKKGHHQVPGVSEHWRVGALCQSERLSLGEFNSAEPSITVVEAPVKKVYPHPLSTFAFLFLVNYCPQEDNIRLESMM